VTISSEIEVYNLALNAVGARSNISSPAENSREAEVCRLWYSPVRDQVLAAAAWPEATEVAYLAQLKQADEDGDGIWAVGDPRPGYSYVYQLPADYLRAQYLNDFSRFLITSYSSNRRAVHTSSYQAMLFYTKRLDNVAQWSPQLAMAIVYALAAHICMPLTGKPSRAKALENKANEMILAARETAANMSHETYESIPDWITARGANYATTQRYYEPYGALLSVSS
jgi:hypothetical protein